MNANLSLYRIFYTVAKNGSISAAATELYISQPAISKSIRKLEENLEVTLFTRSSRGVRLTEEGQILFHHVSSAFDSIQTGESELKRMTSLGIGHLKIGVSTTLCRYMLLPLVKDFVRQYPHIKITIECQSTNQTLALLEQEQIDIGLVARPENLSSLHFDSLGEIEDIFVATETYLHNLSIRTLSDTSDILKTGTLMLLDRENITRQYIDDYLRKNHVLTGDMIEISSMDLLIEFAKINLGIACVVKEFVQKELSEKLLLEIPLKTPIPKRTVGFTYLKNRQASNALKTFLDFFHMGDS